MNARQVVGVAALACLACCIGPILGVLGGIAALGVSSAFIGARALYVHLELAHDQAAVTLSRPRCENL